MIHDIKEQIDKFTTQHAEELTARDIAGINKIQYELGLLEGRFAKPKAKAKRPVEEIKPED